MEIAKLKRRNKSKRTIQINFRISSEESQFMAKHDLSPYLIFHEALKDIRKKPK